MDRNIIGAALAFCVGVAVAWVNFAVSRHVLRKNPEKYAGTTLVRQLIQVAYLVALFFLGAYTPWDRNWLLIGGGIGVTLPMIFFTYYLVKLNDSQPGEEDDTDG